MCEYWPLGRTILLRIKRLCLGFTLTSGNTSESYWSLLTLTSWKTNMTPPYLSIYHTIFTDYILYRMFSLIEHYVPNFPRLNISQKLDIILNGVDPENLEYTTTNTTITYSVQEYILATKRFTAMED